LLADFFAEWLKKPKPDFEKFNRLAFEIDLWLPADLVIELTKTTTWQKDSKHFKDILVEARQILHNKNCGLSGDQLVHFEDNEQHKGNN